MNGSLLDPVVAAVTDKSTLNTMTEYQFKRLEGKVEGAITISI